MSRNKHHNFLSPEYAALSPVVGAWPSAPNPAPVSDGLQSPRWSRILPGLSFFTHLPMRQVFAIRSRST
jgi:hypothetical protein